jgi:hypothetical protein
LGIIDLAAQNKALLFKHIHKFFNKAKVSWVDLTWRAYYTAALAPFQYRGIAKARVGGVTTMFWKDK